MKVKFVVYKSPNEILITTEEAEEEMLAEWFISSAGRDEYEYTRFISTSTAVSITPKLSVSS